MKVLIVCSGNTSGGQEFDLKIHQPFISEQVEALIKFGIEFQFFFIHGKGLTGYLKNLVLLKKKLANKFDLIHAHYGLSGLLVLLVKKSCPLVTTFHGNDINPVFTKNTLKPNLNKLLSRITSFYSDYSIFVNKDLAIKLKANPRKYDIIPCQVDLDIFCPMSKLSARNQCNLAPDRSYVLFSSSFDNVIKNYSLAKQACEYFSNLELIELKGYTRTEVNLLLNACDVALITSFNEGSSQFLKEAMACNCPIVSTKVGDVELLFGEIKGCYITNYEVEDVINKIDMALKFSRNPKRTNGRKRIIELKLDPEHTGLKVYNIYKKIIN